MTNVKKVLVNIKTGEKTEVKYEDGQMQRDGIYADIADGVSGIFGSENTADKVRKDLKIAKAQLQELEIARLKGEGAYKSAFKRIFGVEYDYTKHLSFQKNQEVYLKAAPKHELEMTFNRTFKALLSNAPLRDEKELVSADPSTNVMIETVTANKATVFKREYNNLVELMGENGEAILAELFEKNGVSNASLEDKFEVMKSFAKKWSNELHKETLEAGGGKSFSEIQAKYDNSYKAAYGVENDIMKRVNDYNTSQQIGGQVVKAGAVMAASMVAACSGMGLVGVAGVTSVATVLSEVTDRGSSGKALNTLKEEGFTAYVKTVNDDIDWEATLKQAVISGGSVLIGGAVAKGVNFVMQGQTPIAQAVAMFGADVLTDAALEYVTTGTITIEGVAFAVALNAAGTIVAYKQLSAAADVANSVDEAIDGVIAQPKVDAKTKLANAGFTDDVIANLKAQSDYGPELVDEVLDMIVYLEDQVAAGKPITKELIEGAIDLYFPGANGGSAYTQRSMIANTWNRGDEVFNAYGQKAPGQSTFSTGNMKAKYNKIKNGINDYIDYKKWEWGLDNPTAKTSAVDTSSPTTDFATKLADAKGLDGKPLFKQKDIDLILQGMADLNDKPIPNFEAKVEAVLKNFAEVDFIAKSKNDKVKALLYAILNPTESTIALNPAAFGVKPKTTSAMASTSGTTSNTPDFKTRLMTAESPTDFDPASLQQWADDMGLHLTIEEGSSRTAIFRDDSDNIIRRITEDYRNKGSVYDDRISYYENGRHTAGRLKYNFEPSAKTYEVSLDGEPINIRDVSLSTPENVSKVAASDVKPKAADIPSGAAINEIVETGIPGQKVLVTSDAVNPDEVIVTFFNDGQPSSPIKLPIDELPTYGIKLKASAIEMSVADRLAKEGVPLSISEKYSKAMDYISPFIVGNQDEFAKFAKKYLANPEGFEKALKDIDMRAKEVDYRRQTYQHYGLAHPEGYDNYELMQKEIERLTKLIYSILE